MIFIIITNRRWLYWPFIIVIFFLAAILPVGIIGNKVDNTLLAKAAFTIAVIAAAVSLTQTSLNARIQHDIAKISYVEKQLTELYLPMKRAADLIEWDLANFDVTSIYETSYLASGELEKCIDEFIRCNTIPVTLRVEEQNDVYIKVRAALKADIPKLKEDLDYYLRI